MTESTTLIFGAIAIFPWIAMFLIGPAESVRYRIAILMVATITIAPAALAYTLPRKVSPDGFSVIGSSTSSPVLRVPLYATMALTIVVTILSARHLERIPAPARYMAGCTAAGVPAAILNGQRLTPALVWPCLVIVGIFVAHRWTSEEAVVCSRRAVRVIIWGSLLFMVVKPTSALFSGQGRNWLGVSQLAGLTSHPNGLGSVASIGLILEFSSIARERYWWVHSFGTATVLVLTQSRGSWAAAALGLACLTICNRRVRTRLNLAIAGIAATVVIIVGTGAMDELRRLTRIRDVATLNGRTLLWSRLLADLNGHHLFGLGPEVFTSRYRPALPGVAPGWSHAHNQFLQTFVDSGLVGLALLLVCIGTLLAFALSLASPDRGLALGLLATYLVRFGTETPLYGLTFNSNMLLLIVVLVTVTSMKRHVPETDHCRPSDRTHVDHALSSAGPTASIGLAIQRFAWAGPHL